MLPHRSDDCAHHQVDRQWLQDGLGINDAFLILFGSDTRQVSFELANLLPRFCAQEMPCDALTLAHY